MKSGIYQIRNIVNGRVYVGKSKDIPFRWKGHLSNLRAGTHPNRPLSSDWAAFGESNFVFEVLEYCEESLLRSKEMEWSRRLRSFDKEHGYNFLCDFDGFNGKHAEYTKAQIGKTLSGIKRSEETRKKQREYAKNRPPEVIEKLRAAALAQHRRISDAERKEIGKKISNANKGRVISAETRAKLSDAMRRKWKEDPNWRNHEIGEERQTDEVLLEKTGRPDC